MAASQPQQTKTQPTGRDGGGNSSVLQVVLGIWMTGVILAAFFWSPPLQGLGEAGRIFYFHVPCAWVGTLAYVCAAITGIMYLRTRNLDWDAQSSAAAQVGLLFTVLATLSGAVWAQAAWGKWWNWDPRQVAIFMVLLIYGAYFALRMSLEQPDQRAAIGAVYVILAMVAAFFLTYVAPKMPGIDTLHPSPVLPSGNDEGGIEPRILYVLLASLAGFTGLFFWMWRIQTRIDRLIMRKEHDW